ncbi:Uncharacterized protein BM_BM10680 [Brugia malayi]|uniref:Uncharacterized protein n=1 Tax=Brugia malayi TaxID=6279 RepID=A0A4E9F3G0_BRUMA|nr:Uncharacterized protein BM_BM10680 [Brugia malayi]VIO91322.1 Uncharacterized protein BM_BM10680 [Brugia malayi]
MRSSVLRFCAKVNQETLQVSRKNLFRICGTIVVAEIVLAAYVEYGVRFPHEVIMPIAETRSLVHFHEGSLGIYKYFQKESEIQKGTGFPILFGNIS